MHAVLATMGTDGDVFPYLGLGQELRARGHSVTLLANEHHRRHALELGLQFDPSITESEYEGLIADPRLWHPWKSAALGARLGLDFLKRHYAQLEQHSRAPGSVLVAHPSMLAGRMLQERQGTPMANLVLQPMLLRSTIEPPVLPAGPRLPRWAPEFVARAYLRFVDGFGNRLMRGQLNAFRKPLGLPPIRHVFRWMFSPDLLIGMFPDWYGRPQRDWPPQTRLADFPMHEGVAGEPELDAELAAFCRNGPAPVAFTLGTGMKHAARFFSEAVEACRLLGARGILLTKFSEALPFALPASIRHARFAPFSRLFPLCAAVVHHGGAGTVARALAAGTPQLILPLAWDQPDNAFRVQQLGAGTWLPARRRRAKDLARELQKLAAPEVKAQCQALAGRFAGTTGLARAAVLLEELHAARNAPERGHHAVLQQS